MQRNEISISGGTQQDDFNLIITYTKILIKPILLRSCNDK